MVAATLWITGEAIANLTTSQLQEHLSIAAAAGGDVELVALRVNQLLDVAIATTTSLTIASDEWLRAVMASYCGGSDTLACEVAEIPHEPTRRRYLDADQADNKKFFNVTRELASNASLSSPYVPSATIAAQLGRRDVSSFHVSTTLLGHAATSTVACVDGRDDLPLLLATARALPMTLSSALNVSSRSIILSSTPRVVAQDISTEQVLAEQGSSMPPSRQVAAWRSSYSASVVVGAFVMSSALTTFLLWGLQRNYVEKAPAVAALAVAGAIAFSSSVVFSIAAWQQAGHTAEMVQNSDGASIVRVVAIVSTAAVAVNTLISALLLYMIFFHSQIGIFDRNKLNSRPIVHGCVVMSSLLNFEMINLLPVGSDKYARGYLRKACLVAAVCHNGMLLPSPILNIFIAHEEVEHTSKHVAYLVISSVTLACTLVSVFLRIFLRWHLAGKMTEASVACNEEDCRATDQHQTHCYEHVFGGNAYPTSALHGEEDGYAPPASHAADRTPESSFGSKVSGTELKEAGMARKVAPSPSPIMLSDCSVRTALPPPSKSSTREAALVRARAHREAGLGRRHSRHNSWGRVAVRRPSFERRAERARQGLAIDASSIKAVDHEADASEYDAVAANKTLESLTAAHCASSALPASAEPPQIECCVIDEVHVPATSNIPLTSISPTPSTSEGSSSAPEASSLSDTRPTEVVEVDDIISQNAIMDSESNVRPGNLAHRRIARTAASGDTEGEARMLKLPRRVLGNGSTERVQPALSLQVTATAQVHRHDEDDEASRV